MPMPRVTIGQIAADARRALEALERQANALEAFADAVIDVLRAGGKIMTAGNGGSAAEALHLAEELVGRYHRARRPLAAMSLVADPTVMTCISNDFGFEVVFARQIEALGRRDDALVVLSTSGRSANIIAALNAARGIGMQTLGLLGPADSPAHDLCDLAITVDGHAAARVQELHLLVIHFLLERIDAEFA